MAERKLQRRFDHVSPETPTGGPSLTKQADAHAADIHNIINSFSRTGDPRILQAREGYFGDVADLGDYLSCLNTVKQAEMAFADLPAKVRDHFRNDPSRLLEAFDDPKRRTELEELGVLPKPDLTVPPSSPGTAPAAPDAPAEPRKATPAPAPAGSAPTA